MIYTINYHPPLQIVSMRGTQSLEEVYLLTRSLTKNWAIRRHLTEAKRLRRFGRWDRRHDIHALCEKYIAIPLAVRSLPSTFQVERSNRAACSEENTDRQAKFASAN